MMTTSDIVEVTEATFDYEVLAYSRQVPVVVDFWAPWCRPCRMLGPLLERLAEEAQGTFRLAKVNVDHNPNLALRYNVRSIPAVKAFVRGAVVAEFHGAQPEPMVRAFLRRLAPNPTDLLLEKGNTLLAEQDWEGAVEAFQEALEKQPGHPEALLGLARGLLATDRAAEALPLLHAFPAGNLYDHAERLRPLAEVLARPLPDETATDDPREAAYRHALRLIRRGNLQAALDGLLDVLRQDKHYRDGEVHRVVLALFEVLGPEQPLSRRYQQELANVLF